MGTMETFQLETENKTRTFSELGVSGLMLLVIGRLYSFVKEVNLLSASKEALKRQADQAVVAFKGVQDENELLKKAAGSAQPTLADEWNELKKAAESAKPTLADE